MKSRRFNLLQYINAETTAGGIAHWATSEVAGQLRTNASDWRAAWQDYVQGIIKVTAPNQINNGGPVIGTSVMDFGSLPIFVLTCYSTQQFKSACQSFFLPESILIEVSDNEYSQSPISHAEYFAELEDVYHNSDIVVPLTYNDPGEGRNFINGTVNIPASPLSLGTHTLLARVLWISTGELFDVCA